ncbi:hypothetical protein HGRIS_009580 [Hohenbuehelia grisea]|uniref:Uncharacterized protein n=1 Tax=Hohenbuehelia grisea TaxID=104357 RepID=A0ABR3J226_9AGAR
MRRLGRLFFLVPFAVASPVPSTIESSGSICLVTSLTILFTLSLLLIVKLAFLRRRRSRLANVSASASQISSEKLDSSYTSSASTFITVKSINTDAVSGLWVGMFGSPGWETRQPVKVSSYKQSQQLQFCNRLRSHRRESAFSRRSSAISKGSVVSVGTLGNTPVSSVVRSRVLYNLDNGTHSRSRSLRLPSTPARATLKTPRRFSAPAVTRSASRQDASKARRSSLKSARSRKAAIDGSIHLSAASVRLVGSASLVPDYPLPFTLKTKRSSMGSPSFGTSGPTIDLSPSNSPTTEISRPYPLVSNIKHTRKRNQTMEESSQFWPPTSTAHYYTSSVLPGVSEGQVIVKTPAIPTPMPFNPLDVAMPSPTFSPDFPSFGPPSPVLPPLPSVIRGKPKPRVVSRVRRSPVIGPSPLRSMILPESSESSPAVDVGKGESSSANIDDIDRDRRRRSSLRSAISLDDDGQNNVLLNMIQELVEETSVWDPSLFMDNNFKSMLEESRLSGVINTTSSDQVSAQQSSNGSSSSSVDAVAAMCHAETGTTSTKNSSNYSQSDTESRSGSDEVDLGLLGVELRDNDGRTDAARQGLSTVDVPSPSQRSNELVSFWDEGTWDSAKQRESTESVGLAV